MQKNLFLILLFVTLCVSACGIKPKNLSAPDKAQADQFPKTYPYTR